MDKYTHDRDDPRIAEEQAARAERCAAAAAVADIFFLFVFEITKFNFFVMKCRFFFSDRLQKASLRKNSHSNTPPHAQLTTTTTKNTRAKKKKIHIV
jgi:hypothetical protein